MPPTGNGSSVQQRARTGGGVDPQDGMFDKQWEDADLEAALEARESARQARLDASKAFKLKDDAAKDKLASYELAVGEVARCGRFRIKKTQPAGRDVSFTTDPAPRLNIKLEADD